MTPQDTATRTMRISNIKGLHARASAKFVETVDRFDASAYVTCEGLSACGDSIMGLLTLGASEGKSIEVEAKGTQATDLLDALEALLNAKFHEGR